jgi:hypothetical protein
MIYPIKLCVQNSTRNACSTMCHHAIVAYAMCDMFDETKCSIEVNMPRDEEGVIARCDHLKGLRCAFDAICDCEFMEHHIYYINSNTFFLLMVSVQSLQSAMFDQSECFKVKMPSCHQMGTGNTHFVERCGVRVSVSIRKISETPWLSFL